MIGPVQLLVLGFDQPDFQGGIMAELQRLRDSDTVRLLDGLAVYKDPDGNVAELHMSQLDGAEMDELGATIGALIGFGAGGEEGAELGAELGMATVEEREGVFDAEGAWDVLADIPPDTAAALLLIEHRWAVPLRDAVALAGGTRLASEFISPLDLVAVGMASNEEARTLLAVGGDAV